MKLNKEIKKLYSLMEDILDYDGIKEFIKCDVDDIWSNDFGLTLWVRNNVLDDSNTIYRDFVRNGIKNKDVISYELIDSFYWYLKLKEKIIEYKILSKQTDRVSFHTVVLLIINAGEVCR